MSALVMNHWPAVCPVLSCGSKIIGPPQSFLNGSEAEFTIWCEERDHRVIVWRTRKHDQPSSPAKDYPDDQRIHHGYASNDPKNTFGFGPFKSEPFIRDGKPVEGARVLAEFNAPLTPARPWPILDPYALGQNYHDPLVSDLDLWLTLAAVFSVGMISGYLLRRISAS